MPFPEERPRRLRGSVRRRAMVAETRLHRDRLIWPLFAVPGTNVEREIPGFAGVQHHSVDRLVEACRRAVGDYGLRSVLLFGLPEAKDAEGSGAWAEEGIVQQACRAIRAAKLDIEVITDVCLCEYTDHGHCGVLTPELPNRPATVDNDPTLELLARTAVSHAAAGADMVAPSDMMDGRIGALRAALDDEGHDDLPIMAYSAKYASAFYGPFRLAADSAPAFGDRRTYQMDPANADEAMREIALDIDEGADIVMVKPGLPYLDIIRRAKDTFPVPIAAYNVSGEYVMLKALAAGDAAAEERLFLEATTSLCRAGADLVITYAAPLVARAIR
ncbi:MAG TPA: porphobilinogen synthase [Candidatus Eisenbacteria bacterium]